MHRVPLALLLLLVACSCSTPSSTNHTDATTKAGESYRAVVYSQAFADRFGYSRDGVHSLDKGLQAIAFRVIERAGRPPRCVVDLYVDEDLDLDYPVGSEGKSIVDDDEDEAFFVHSAPAFVPSDARWEKRIGSFQTVACKDTPRRCFVDQGSPDAFSRRILPGISFQTYDAACVAVDPKAGPYEVVVLRAGRESAALDIVSQAEHTADVYHFAIPDTLIRHVAVRAALAAHVYERPLPSPPVRGSFSIPNVR